LNYSINAAYKDMNRVTNRENARIGITRNKQGSGAGGQVHERRSQGEIIKCD
jgi:hypothetical protein